ncbi:hypothetical protein CHLRE_12g518950v5 [Chlamydomonas reinhardtii]|uniref:Phosphoglycerate mutase-like protein n=1 Tax=Chlamydomonas reinhardtii TaxID=3055 RepID=A0A2K3D400_CHLRE|nr:uncharacterized protein CHLRE_12g518950v5 [Chlamydomonas reinhardtii]PNW75247.1 hypothetical protein CHLRE_12g518950v5 [Chlamydomonas reinhardtii]
MPPTNRVADPEDAENTKNSVCPRINMIPVKYTKTIHFVRHGQGFHNVAGQINHDNYKSWEHFDAHLTELGWRQAENLGKHVAATRLPVELVVVAPLQRAMETAVAAFGKHEDPAVAAAAASGAANGNGNGVSSSSGDDVPLLMVAQEGVEGKATAHAAVSGRGCPPFLAHELCREHIGVHPCDKRSSITEYRKRFPGIDFSLVSPDEDVLWTADVRESKEAIRRRGLAFLKWLLTRPEREIAVVTHSSFLHFTLSCFGHGAATQVQGELHKWYENCEMRTVVLTDDSDEGVAAASHGATDPWHFAGGSNAVSGQQQ